MPLAIMGNVEQLLLSLAVGVCIYFFLKYYGILDYISWAHKEVQSLRVTAEGRKM